MSLTLEEVRRVRFRMARRGQLGYAVDSVDDFIDKVELAFDQFEKEQQRLQRELDSAGGEAGPGAGAVAAELESSQKELAEAKAQLEELRAENERLKQTAEQASDDDRVAELMRQNEQLQSELAAAKKESAERLHSVEKPSEVTGKITVQNSAEASSASVRVLEMAMQQADRLVAEAEANVATKVSEAERQANEITRGAEAEAERVQNEARTNAENVKREAEERAGALEIEVQQRRKELMAQLQQEQIALQGTVAKLRDFEGKYRENMHGFLQRQIGLLEAEVLEPEGGQELLAAQNTPRLDAVAAGDN